MASIRRPHSPAKAQHLLRHHHPFSTASPPSSPLRHASSASSSSSPRKSGYPHPFLFFTRRPLPRFAAFFLLGSFIGLLHFLSHLPLHPHLPAHPSSSHLNHLQQQQQQEQGQPITQQRLPDAAGSNAEEHSGQGKLLIVVTPTRARASQAYYLSRMGQTLRLVRPPVLWVVVEAGKPTPEAALALRRTAVMHRYVGCCDALNASASPAVDFRPHQLNAGLEVVENHRLDGVVYFADEEGVYSLPLFDRLRQIRRFGTWPVPTISDGGHGVVLEGPVCKQNQVVGWHTSGDANKLQRFHVAMSGFAFNSTMLWDPRLRSHKAWNSIRHPEMVEQGFQGTTFVEQLVEDESQMEGIPADCSQIMNWHVPFGSESPVYPKGWRSAANLDVIIPLK
ncbi:probable glucuronosyltransferase Os04g0103100 [Hordeum vulgare subsp. vulgare]|uniref:Glycosyltransferases n=1 Tax=Hordeum vulgare subsp. vulgare TaxID=112509 RepID=A0A8I6X0P6_HORVV|nr:probable glucuronosyltransferase Os04g0103100 [Hordeum vulgare subsp. vulgare]